MNTERNITGNSTLELVKLFVANPAEVSTHRAANRLRQWCLDYLCRPHPDLGRRGPVCPYTGPAIAHENLWAAFIDGPRIGVETMTDIAEELLDRFWSLSPRTGSNRIWTTVLAVFPDLVDYTVIETVQQDLKTKFVLEGLMVGQFYPGCKEPGLHNPNFPALDAPLPMIAIRHMVPSDFPFLTDLPEWIGIYLKRFAPDIPTTVNTFMANRLARTAESPA